MALKKVLSIRDTKAAFYNVPLMVTNTTEEAVRSFGELATDSRTSIARHPEDYDLYEIGEFDDQTGVIASYDAPIHVMKALHHPALQKAANAASNVAPMMGRA